jgi:Leucine-rich repeat (LRR) protein
MMVDPLKPLELVNRWYYAAENEVDTSNRDELYSETENAISSIKKLKKLGKIEEAKTSADLILQPLANHKEGKDDKSIKLAQWIAKNTAPSGEGARSMLKQLLKTLKKLEPDHSENLTSLKNIGASAKINFDDGKNVSVPAQWPDELTARIFGEYIQNRSFSEAIALKLTSPKFQKLVSEIIPYGCLQLRGITTAEKAIQEVKEHGKDLEFLNISEIKFTLEQFNEFIQYVPNLTRFVAGSCGFTAEFAKELTGLTKLTRLDLGNNKIGPEGAKSIAGALKDLTILDLWNNDIKDEGGIAIAGLTKLRSLNVSSNDIGPKGFEAICKSLLDLDTLNIMYNRIEESIKSISALIKLRILYLNGNNVGDEGPKAIAPLTNLVKLYLTCNNIGVIDDLVFLENLKELYLNDNNIEDKGLIPIATLSKLEVLELERNKITSGEKIVSLISYLANLIALEIRENAIEAKGIEIITNQLKSRPYLHAYLPEIDEW